MDIDLVNAAVSLSHAKLDGQVQILVAKKMLDAEQMQGSAAVNLIQAADNGMDAAAGKMLAATTGLGSALDVNA
jgi:hypothetical protein